MKYPYIGETALGRIVLFNKESSGKAIKHDVRTNNNRVYNDWNERKFTNITHEYMQNTYGEVQSPEHAEFIVELCKAHGIKVISSIPRKCSSFLILSQGNAYFYDNDISELFEGEPLKKVTIPLLPKADNQELTEVTPESFNCSCAIVDIEWPQVGDEVEFPTGKGVLIVGKPDEQRMVIVKSDDEQLGSIYKRVSLSAIKKPKTPEEELRDEMLSYIEGIYSVDSCAIHEIAKDLIKFHNITKKA